MLFLTELHSNNASCRSCYLHRCCRMSAKTAAGKHSHTLCKLSFVSAISALVVLHWLSCTLQVSATALIKLRSCHTLRACYLQ